MSQSTDRSEHYRSHDCGALRENDIGSSVTLNGWVHRRRDHGGLIFIDLRDRYGITQLVIDPEELPEGHRLRSEWVVTISGDVIARAEGMANPKLATGAIEVKTRQLLILSKAKTPPFSICDEVVEANEEVRLKHRYLDIRRGRITQNLVARHRMMLAARNYLDNAQFLEVATPILGKSTPEGARDYLVPSRIYPGHFYALPQSPQLFKQLLMIGGLDRYFQIAPCFRDEDLRADRQPEFTQIDMEMSFGTPELFLPIVEGLLDVMFKSVGITLPSAPFTRMSYAECMERYGTDRPDLRFGMELQDVTTIAKQSNFAIFQEQCQNGNIVKGLCVKGGSDLSRRQIDEHTTFVGRLGIQGLAWMKFQNGALTSSIVKFFSDEQQQQLISRMEVEEGDLIFMVADSVDRTNQALDHLRRQLARDRNLIAAGSYSCLWVTDFPLFEWDGEEQRMVSVHHPFTCPHPDDLPLLKSDPLQVRSSGYDIVLNGYEIGGGSQRIHDTTMQQQVFDLLKVTSEQQQQLFGFFLRALEFGTPPHLGIALGLDRILMIATGTDNIRDVIAFPKTQKASDLMINSPDSVDNTQLGELHIAIEE